MPDIWTHILFGEEVVSEMNSEEVGLIQRWPTLFRFACQGPDFLFYYRFWPWQNSRGVNIIGGKIHKNAGGEFIHQSIIYLRDLQSQGMNGFPQPVDKAGDNVVGAPGAAIAESEQLKVYLMGLICHYALDASTHPFIHHNCGIYHHADSKTYQYKGNHKYFEQLIDVILLQEKRGLQASQELVYRQIDLGKELPQSVIKMYQILVGKFFQRQLSAEEINTAYRDMVNGWKIFHDPWKIKVFLIQMVKVLTLGKIKYYQYFYPHTVDRSVDYLNRKQKQWCHPADKNEIYKTSFDQLWEQGKERAHNWIKSMSKHLTGELSREEMIAEIPNLSFSSGKEPGLGDEEQMRYFSPVVSLK